MDLKSNFLNSSIPPEIGTLSAVTYLDLLTNLLTDSIPAGITGLTALEFLSYGTGHTVHEKFGVIALNMLFENT